jgi:hypothetical protein
MIKQIIRYVFISLLLLFLIHIEKQIDFMKADINNNNQAIQDLQNDVLYNKPMYDEDGNLLNPEYFEIFKNNATDKTKNRINIPYNWQTEDNKKRIENAKIDNYVELDRIKRKQDDAERENESNNYWNNQEQAQKINELQKKNIENSNRLDKLQKSENFKNIFGTHSFLNN